MRSRQFGTSAELSERHFGTSAELSGHFGTSLMVPKCLGSEVSWVRSVLTPHQRPSSFFPLMHIFYLLTTSNSLQENNTPMHMDEHNLEETISNIWSLLYPTALQLGIFTVIHTECAVISHIRLKHVDCHTYFSVWYGLLDKSRSNHDNFRS